MLVPTRKTGQSIVIGENIKVTCLGIKDGQVKIGVDAPADVTVNREEIHKRIQEGRKQGDGK